MKKLLVIFAFSFPLANILFSQEIVPIEAWLSYSAKYSLNKKWRLTGSTQWRPDNYPNSVNPFLLQAEARKKINKNSAINLQYRYSWYAGERNAQRLALDGKFKWKVKNKSNIVQYRSRLQVTRVNVNGQIISAWRNKIGFEKRIIKEVSVHLDYENFLELIKIKSFLRVDPPNFNKHRFTLGAKYKMNSFTLKAFYRLEDSFSFNNSSVHIFGLGISTKIK